ncbi:DNA polymerase V [Parabacteroides sp. PFB2-10]|uniref:LexA family protein n=1 Tax=Parabacteroides sp. PFB2-10 TaxID=1742405 RepID=UPI0024734C95|nr:translesion error-prone DNA polymerase V autoproteolytic subunit [Parabacteroides sp. PFB2-10]MDH6313026.1 DNA polymerase V [Parabacteroides sp. PFB2-10]MDL2281570.1 translesion error-prone DNA polymerase V autoproteolytic subunit [Parabacteroides sp. OttesenSCG-928-G06]MDL2281587.1 translesion error-prone DNA polymerase V autoproteolytic subunit [Parabacteroides sp. OttesenSCG-928-G06]
MQTINVALNKLIPIADELVSIEVDLYSSPIAAGFPSEAYNYIEQGIDFNKLLIKSKETTFCLVAGGDSLSGDGIFPGDLLVVDKLVEPYEKSILIFSIDGEFTMKRLEYRKDHIALLSSNPKYDPIIVKDGEELKRWGVVRYVIKSF